MKRSKWCKYCICNKQTPVCSGIMGYDRCIRKFKGLPDIAEQSIQTYRELLAKQIKTERRKSRISVLSLYKERCLSYINCARMLDHEKSAKVAKTVQAIKEYRALRKEKKQ